MNNSAFPSSSSRISSLLISAPIQTQRTVLTSSEVSSRPRTNTTFGWGDLDTIIQQREIEEYQKLEATDPLITKEPIDENILEAIRCCLIIIRKRNEQFENVPLKKMRELMLKPNANKEKVQQLAYQFIDLLKDSRLSQEVNEALAEFIPKTNTCFKTTVHPFLNRSKL